MNQILFIIYLSFGCQYNYTAFKTGLFLSLQKLNEDALTKQSVTLNSKIKDLNDEILKLSASVNTQKNSKDMMKIEVKFFSLCII